MDQIKIGAFLKTLRKEKNLTQEQLAEHLGISSRTVSRWETGSNMPDISLLTEIAEFYDVSIPELIHGERKSEKMNEEVKDVVNSMADYADAEKKNIIKSVRNQSLIGVCALIILVILELAVPKGSSNLADTIYLYCQTLIYVTVALICLVSTGLLYKLRKGRKHINMPKLILWVLAGIVAFGVAAAIKFLFSLT